MLLTGAVTWALDLELPTAYSTALLVLITGTAQFAYVVGVALPTYDRLREVDADVAVVHTG